MNYHILKTEADFNKAVKELDQLLEIQFEGKNLTEKQQNHFDILTLLIEDYETDNCSLPTIDPIDLIIGAKENHRLKDKDLVPYIGSKTMVSLVLNRKRKLTLPMIRSLSEGLNLPAEILVKDYTIEDAKQVSTVASKNVSRNQNEVLHGRRKSTIKPRHVVGHHGGAYISSKERVLK